MKIERIPLGNIKDYENNPRRNANAIKKVAESIKQFGFNTPLIIDDNNILVAGHTRLEALKLLGYHTADCVRVSGLTEAQIKSYRIIDNKVSEFSGWDFEKLNQELSSIIDNVDFDFEDFGISVENLIKQADIDNMPVEVQEHLKGVDVNALRNDYKVQELNDIKEYKKIEVFTNKAMKTPETYNELVLIFKEKDKQNVLDILGRIGKPYKKTLVLNNGVWE